MHSGSVRIGTNPRTGKITAGPVWDFDRAQGSTDGRDFDYGTWTAAGGTDFFTYPWYKEMMLDPNFWQQWIDRYAEFSPRPAVGGQCLEPH